MLTFYNWVSRNNPHMESDSGRRTTARVFLVIGLIALVALAGCVQGEEESDDGGFNPEEAANSGGGGGGSSNGGGGGGNDGGAGDDTTLAEEEAAKGFDTLKASGEIKRELNERRERAGKQPFEHSQSLKVAARDFSQTLADQSELSASVENGSVIDTEVSEQNIISRYEEHNAVDCRKNGQWLPGQLNHVTLFNRSLRTSKERLIRYDNEELLAIAVVEDWLANGSTRNVIMETGYRQVGVGTVYEESSDIVYVTANFC